MCFWKPAGRIKSPLENRDSVLHHTHTLPHGWYLATAHSTVEVMLKYPVISLIIGKGHCHNSFKGYARLQHSWSCPSHCLGNTVSLPQSRNWRVFPGIPEGLQNSALTSFLVTKYLCTSAPQISLSCTQILFKDFRRLALPPHALCPAPRSLELTPQGSHSGTDQLASHPPWFWHTYIRPNQSRPGPPTQGGTEHPRPWYWHSSSRCQVPTGLPRL